MDSDLTSLSLKGDVSAQTTTSPEAGIESIYKVVAGYLQHYVPIVFLVVGVVTNLTTLLTMTQPLMRKQSISLYLSCLALSDTACLIFISVEFWQQVEPSCHVIGMLLSSSTTCSGLLTLAVTVERSVAVWFPLKARVWLQKKRARVFVLMVIILSYTMYLPRVFYASDEHYCDPTEQYDRAYFIQAMVFYSFGPICLLLLTNTAIILKLNMQSSILQDSTSSQTASSQDIRRASYLVVTISITYIILTLPFSFTIVHFRFTRAPLFSNPDVEGLWYVIIFSLVMLNHCVNFWLYCIVSSKFRKALRLILLSLCGAVSSKQANTPMSIKSVSTDLYSESVKAPEEIEENAV